MAKSTIVSVGQRRMPLEPMQSQGKSSDDLAFMKLCAAQEILAEVFGISLAEAEEMIKQRSRERMLWPERFSAGDSGSG
ncbi:MAG: hypothetical protein MUE87_02155 [Methanothrix sp.]|jgi:hypothetical protein|nr:hypothetical protein [Methanothrix sp.]